MPRIARSRVKHLERLANVDGPPIGRLPPWARALVVEVALAGGLEPWEVIAEAEAILEQAAAAGVLGSRAKWAAFLAAEGADPEALLAEAGRWLARRCGWGSGWRGSR
jgi:hypothetical protein